VRIGGTPGSPAPPGIAARHDVDLDRRRLGHADHGVGVEVSLYHATLVDGDLSVQRGAQAEHDAALHLRLDLTVFTAWPQSTAQTTRGTRTAPSESTATSATSTHTVGSPLRHRNAATPACRQRRAPPGLLGRELERPPVARFVTQQLAPQHGHRIAGTPLRLKSDRSRRGSTDSLIDGASTHASRAGRRTLTLDRSARPGGRSAYHTMAS